MHQYACVCQSSASFFGVQLIQDVHKILLYAIIICHISVVVSIYLNNNRDMIDKSPSQTVSLKKCYQENSKFSTESLQAIHTNFKHGNFNHVVFYTRVLKKSQQLAVLHCKSRYREKILEVSICMLYNTVGGGIEQNNRFHRIIFPL